MSVRANKDGKKNVTKNGDR